MQLRPLAGLVRSPGPFGCRPIALLLVQLEDDLDASSEELRIEQLKQLSMRRVGVFFSFLVLHLLHQIDPVEADLVEVRLSELVIAKPQRGHMVVHHHLSRQNELMSHFDYH